MTRGFTALRAVFFLQDLYILYIKYYIKINFYSFSKNYYLEFFFANYTSIADHKMNGNNEQNEK